MQHKLLHPSRLITLFKCIVYGSLLWNLGLFFREDWSAAAVRLGSSRDFWLGIEVFAQTIDQLAWVGLLLLFEWETSLLPDAALRSRRMQWTLHGARAVCGLVIVNSLLGYAGKLATYLGAQSFAGDACTLLDAGWSLLLDLDEFTPLAADNCSTLAGGAFRLAGAQVLASAEVLQQSQRFALVDVVNAAAWVLVVMLLELDVRLQMRGLLTGLVLKVSAALKIMTYAVLVLAAVYWGVQGAIEDSWDATLWLVAFVFIEMNLFKWHEESERLAAQPVIHVT